MPYPNEHSCQLVDPDKFERCIRKQVKDENEVDGYEPTGKPYTLLICYTKDEESEVASFRYDKDIWTVEQAKRHCQAHDGSFEPASEEKSQLKEHFILSPGIEERSFQITIRAADGDDQEPKIIGHAAVFNQLSDDLGGFRERIQPGAFAKTLREADVRALWQHDVNYVLGRRKNDTLRVWEDENGLAFEILPPNTQWASDALVTLRRGDVDQMSFGFITIRDRWEEDEEEKVFIRTLVEVELFDVSPVTFPAYPQTSAQVRSTLSELQRSIAAAPGQGPHPADADDDQARARLEMLRRRLDLLEVGN